MAGWVVAAIALIGLAWAGWHWWLARQHESQLRQQLVAARRDLTSAQDEAGTLQARQAAMGTAITDVLLVLDEERRIVWSNLAAHELFGDVNGKPLIEATRSHELEALLDEPRSTEGATMRQIILSQQTFGARLAPMAQGDVLTLQDLSELQRLGRARRDFVANISHELRTPLASIRLLVDTLQAGALSDPAVAQEMLPKINVEVDALSQLARELLDLSLIESGQMPLKLEPTDLRDLAQTQVERFSPQARQKKQALIVDIEPETCVLADGEMIGRVLSNLLHNACKFTPPGGQIRVGARTEGDNVVVSVADTGPGIPREELSRVFERFYKLDRARGQSGTGLGLAIARHIVEGHGGRIWAESEPGRGATFCFTLSAG